MAIRRTRRDVQVVYAFDFRLSIQIRPLVTRAKHSSYRPGKVLGFHVSISVSVWSWSRYRPGSGAASASAALNCILKSRRVLYWLNVAFASRSPPASFRRSRSWNVLSDGCDGVGPRVGTRRPYHDQPSGGFHAAGRCARVSANAG